MTLPTLITEKLGKLIPRLATDSDGERIATVAAITRTLAAGGHDLYDLAAHVAAPAATGVVPARGPCAEPGSPAARTAWAAIVAECQRHRERLSPWEGSFIDSIARWLDEGRRLSVRQAACVVAIHDRLLEGAQ